jgi:hypothetical protein
VSKQVVDPEAPLSLFEIAPDGKNLVPPPGTPPVLSAFDENALEAALKIKDAVGARVVVISLGNKLAKPVLKKALAAGADELILLGLLVPIMPISGPIQKKSEGHGGPYSANIVKSHHPCYIVAPVPLLQSLRPRSLCRFPKKPSSCAVFPPEPRRRRAVCWGRAWPGGCG